MSGLLINACWYLPGGTFFTVWARLKCSLGALVVIIMELSMQNASPQVPLHWRHIPILLLRKVRSYACECFPFLLCSNWRRIVSKSSRQVGNVYAHVSWSFHWPLFVEQLDLLLHLAHFWSQSHLGKVRQRSKVCSSKFYGPGPVWIWGCVVTCGLIIG